MILKDEQDQKLLDLIWPLRVNNTRICKGMVSRTMGFSWKSPELGRRKPSLEQQVQNELYEFQGQPVVTKIAKGSPAELAGLQKGESDLSSWRVAYNSRYC